MKEHTPGPLTYEMGNDSGKNWLVATVEFGRQPDGSEAWGSITTDHVQGSRLVYGDPEADMRLWSAAPDLLAACEAALWLLGKDEDRRKLGALNLVTVHQIPGALRAAITKARGEKQT